MACLTGKRSSQNLLLRVLKVVIQLREAARKSMTKGSTQKRTGLSRGNAVAICTFCHWAVYVKGDIIFKHPVVPYWPDFPDFVKRA